MNLADQRGVVERVEEYFTFVQTAAGERMLFNHAALNSVPEALRSVGQEVQLRFHRGDGGAFGLWFVDVVGVSTPDVATPPHSQKKIIPKRKYA